jgi:hypothetical protein
MFIDESVFFEVRVVILVRPAEKDSELRGLGRRRAFCLAEVETEALGNCAP